MEILLIVVGVVALYIIYGLIRASRKVAIDTEVNHIADILSASGEEIRPLVERVREKALYSLNYNREERLATLDLVKTYGAKGAGQMLFGHWTKALLAAHSRAGNLTVDEEVACNVFAGAFYYYVNQRNDLPQDVKKNMFDDLIQYMPQYKIKEVAEHFGIK